MTALLRVEEAQQRLLGLKAPLAAELMGPGEAFGRFAAADIVARRDQPGTAVAAMDGHAVRFGDGTGPWTISGTVAAGEAPSFALGPGEAARIFTGAVLPALADTVIAQEDTRADGAMLVLAGEAPPMRGRHVRGRASDFGVGDILLAGGERLTPGAIAAAIMGGALEVAVGTRPRVAIVTTGDELAAPGEALSEGRIPDSNGPMLGALLAAEPALVSATIRVPDSRDGLAAILAQVARNHDVIVTVGGASVGDHDHVRASLTLAGGHLDFWKIAMRPGKPLIAGTLGGAVLLGLPGNPSSAFVTATLFLLPLVRHLAGARHPLPKMQQAPLAVDLGPGGTRRDYLRARLAEGRISPLDSQDSGQTRPLAVANALLVREIDAAAAAAGTIADYIAIA